MSGIVGRRRGGRLSSCPMNMGQVEIRGHAYLYFNDNYSYFQGTINTEEESNYSIFGEVTKESERAHQQYHGNHPKSKLHSAFPPLSTSSTESSTPYESDEDVEMDFDSDESEGHLGFLPKSGSKKAINFSSSSTDDETEEGLSYRMSLTDHYTGLLYNFPSILVNRHPRNDDTLLLSCDPNARIHFKTEAVYKGQKAAMVIQKSIGSSSLLGKNCIVYSGEMHLSFSDDFLVSERNWTL